MNIIVNNYEAVFLSSIAFFGIVFIGWMSGWFGSSSKKPDATEPTDIRDDTAIK